MDLHPFATANEPTTLPLPFPDLPVEIGDELPDGAANEPPAEGDSVAPPPQVAGSRPPREPRFDWTPGWRGQDARLAREHLFDKLSTRWREERRRRYLEAVLTSQPEHELPWRPYGDPTHRPVAG
jgi:hypothetical protein